MLRLRVHQQWRLSAIKAHIRLDLTSCRDPQHDGYQVGVAKVQIQSWGRSVTYQTYFADPPRQAGKIQYHVNIASISGFVCVSVCQHFGFRTLTFDLNFDQVVGHHMG